MSRNIASFGNSTSRNGRNKQQLNFACLTCLTENKQTKLEVEISVEFRVRKRKKFEEEAAAATPVGGDKVVLEVEVGDEVAITKKSSNPLEELKRIAEGRGQTVIRAICFIHNSSCQMAYYNFDGKDIKYDQLQSWSSSGEREFSMKLQYQGIL